MDGDDILIDDDELQLEFNNVDLQIATLPETYDPVEEEKEEEKVNDGRDEWGSNIEFILSTIGSVVGLGNLWRFPIKVKEYGGAVFLIPYFIMLLVEGIPLFMVELWIGQKFRAGCIGGFYKINKYLTGIGFATWMIGFYTNLYYNAVIMYTIYYFFASFSATLPWATPCPEVIGTEVSCCTNLTRARYYWYYEVLQISDSINNADGFNWQCTLCLFAAWLTCFLCMLKGIKTSGKVVYVTAVFPFMALLGLFIMSMTLPGSGEGVKYFFDPTYQFSFVKEKNASLTNETVASNWDNLLKPYCWMEAATQIFYSLSLGFGSCIAFASYNPPKTNFYRHALGISVVNSVSSMLAGVTIFAIIGSSAVLNEIPISELTTGPGLAFIAVSEAIAKVPAAQLWSALFFLMLFMLGIDSQFAGVEGMMTALDDTTLLPKKVNRTIIIGGFCGFSFLLGLPFGLRSGLYLVDLFDNFSANFPLMMVAFFEVIAISWVYGINRFCKDFEDMTGYYPNIVWKFLWVVLTPATLAFILIYSLIDMFQNPITYDRFTGCGEVPQSQWTTPDIYPAWGWVLAAFLVLSSFLFIPGMALLAVLPKLFGPRFEIKLPLAPCLLEKNTNGQTDAEIELDTKI